MTVALWSCIAMLVVAAGLALFRLEKGPTTMDRAVALDVITATVIGLVIVTMALTGRRDLIPVLVVLALVGFVASTTIARFAVAETEQDRRLATPEEIAQQLALEAARRDDDAPVHDDGGESIPAGESGPVGSPPGSRFVRRKR